MALLFLIPGRRETIRVNGRAIITTDAATLAVHAVDGKAPATLTETTCSDAFGRPGGAALLMASTAQTGVGYGSAIAELARSAS